MDENKKSSYFGICQYLATCDQISEQVQKFPSCKSASLFKGPGWSSGQDCRLLTTSLTPLSRVCTRYSPLVVILWTHK
jgi:hypothetical protein